MAFKTFEIKTRIMSQPKGSSKLILFVKNNYWTQRYYFTVKDSKELRDYLKSDEFKVFTYSVFSKYEGMTYEEEKELWEFANSEDKKRIQEKLDIFAWRPEDKQFEIKVSLKLTRTYDSYFTYRVEFSNNIDNSRCWFRRFYSVSYISVYGANCILDDFACYLRENKEFSDKLASYKTWDEFRKDWSSDDFVNMMDGCLMDAKSGRRAA